jgi:hypothetical protein
MKRDDDQRNKGAANRLEEHEQRCCREAEWLRNTVAQLERCPAKSDRNRAIGRLSAESISESKWERKEAYEQQQVRDRERRAEQQQERKELAQQGKEWHVLHNKMKRGELSKGEKGELRNWKQ